MEKLIIAKWVECSLEITGYSREMRVISSTHPRFVVGYRFDYGFLGIASEEEYIITILPL